MHFLDLFLAPQIIAGTLLGVAAAGLVHWIAPAPEPLLVEAGLVALGFFGSLLVGSGSEGTDEVRRHE